ncbi:hypothetical protein [Rhizomicrobium electricum]|jgi:hypothetical protein|uniref:Yip1 domain-containing protein n=1 Tax=Rhizomicrobium electricum TaxID=480070 RepID=A0ABN1F9S9_9PROT|nr:hypothetical protein [Rhizomicrobium electricum]NIJ50627.1 hypothetical protein [Rhizomicrobium electricum]
MQLNITRAIAPHRCGPVYEAFCHAIAGGNAMASDEKQHGFSLGWFAYQQIASILGACSLLIFCGHYIHIDWSGIFQALILAWNQTVVPVVRLVLDETIVAFLKWAFHWSIVIPAALRDYLTVGIVLGMAFGRVVFTACNESRCDKGDYAAAIIFTLINIVLWPLVVAYYIKLLTESDTRMSRVLSVFLPFLYAIAMVGANYYLHHQT